MKTFILAWTAISIMAVAPVANAGECRYETDEIDSFTKGSFKNADVRGHTFDLDARIPNRPTRVPYVPRARLRHDEMGRVAEIDMHVDVDVHILLCESRRRPDQQR